MKGIVINVNRIMGEGGRNVKMAKEWRKMNYTKRKW